MRENNKTKLFLLLIIVLFIPFQNCCYAQNAPSVAGYIYSSDIQAYVNGLPINSYNIGGRTVIVCEDLVNYGFDVTWNEQARRLDVQAKYFKLDLSQISVPEKKKIKSGKIAGEIYKTDIGTFLNNVSITSYNIGGKTVIACEEMATYGFNVDWNGDERTISVNVIKAGDSIDTDIGTFSIANPVYPNYYLNNILSSDYSLTIDGSTKKFDSSKCLIVKVETDVPYVPLKTTLEAFHKTYLWDKENRTLKISGEDNNINSLSSLEEGARLDRDSFSAITEPVYFLNCKTHIDHKVDFEKPFFQMIKDENDNPVYWEMSDYLPVVYNGILYYPLEPLAQYLGLAYEDYKLYSKDQLVAWDYMYEFLIMGNEKINDWIISSVPRVEKMVGMHGYGLACDPLEPDQTAQIKFARQMSSETMNKDYIVIIEKDNASIVPKRTIVSDKFDYQYNSETNVLSISLKDKSLLDTYITSSGSKGDIREDVSRFVVYIRNGIKDIKGNEMPYNLKWIIDYKVTK